MRRFAILVGFAIAAHWQAGYAQTLEVAEWTPQGKKIVATVKDLPEGSRLMWRPGTGGEAEKFGDGRAYLWGSVGVQTPLDVVVIPPGDGEAVWLTGSYGVEGDAPPTPPVPAVKTLAQLAGQDAPDIAKILTAISNVVADLDLDKFPTVLTGSLSNWKANPAVPVIVKRLALADMEAIAGELEKIIADLGSLPTPPEPPPVPPVVPGKRHVILLHETEEQTPELGSLFNELRTGDSAKAIKAAGHTLDILDDDLRTDLTGVPLPAMYVVDPSTKAVLYSQPMPHTAPEIVGAIR